MQKKCITIIIIIFFLTGCASFGPRSICLDRNRYNCAIRDTNHSQLLTNIVHLRYVEPTFFMKLSNVTSSFSLEAGLNNTSGGVTFLGATFLTGTDPFVSRTAQLNPGFGYADRPTISYVPIDDAQFAREIMVPSSLERLQLLFSGGIDEPTTLLRLTIQSINELDNASSATSAKLSRLPCYQEYYEFLRQLMELYGQGTCGLFPEKTSEGNYTVGIHFNDCCVHSPPALAIKRMLRVSPDARDILFSSKMHHNQPNTVFVKMRSVYGMMTYLSYSIQVPEADLRSGRVYQYCYPDGRPFDWTPLMKGLMTIYSSDTMPCDAFVKTFIHGHWFYIKDSDPDSKTTFALLSRLITLAAGRSARDESFGSEVSVNQGILQKNVTPTSRVVQQQQLEERRVNPKTNALEQQAQQRNIGGGHGAVNTR